MKRRSLLEKVSELDIFLHFINDLDESLIRRSGNPGRNILSPFKEENHPSCSIYENKQGKINYKCHTSGLYGDCFQLVADLNNLDCKTQFGEVLKKVNDSMNLGLDQPTNRYQSEVWKAEYYEQFTKKAIDFWALRNVEVATLKKYGVRQLKVLIYRQDKNSKAATNYYHQKGQTAFEFTVNGRKKLYMPSSLNPHLKRKYYIKTQNNNDIFGLRQLPRKKQKFILILEGEGDVLCAIAHGLPAVCFQSATTMPTKGQIRMLRRKASNLILCYDLDDAGRKAAANITYKFPSLINLDIPKDATAVIEDEGKEIGLVTYVASGKSADKITTYKDLSDWLPNAHVSDFRMMIDRAIKEGRKSQYLHLWEHGYCYMKYDQKANTIAEVSNFLVEVDAQVMKEKESFRLCRFLARDAQTDTIAVPSAVFNSDTKFAEFVGNLRGNFRFSGTRKDLLAIQKMTFGLSDYLEEVPRMGWNGKFDCFVMSNAVLNGKVAKPNAEGIVDRMYIPAANDNNLEDSTFAGDLKIRYQQQSKIKQVYQFYDILASSYTPQVATMSFAYIFSGLFFDWIARKGVSNWFPLFCVAGQKGSGKGSLVKLLMKLFTSDPEEVSITNATKTGFVRILEQVANIPAWLDEFRNSISNEKIEALKNIYDLIGKVIGRKTNDSRTKRSKILRPTFLTGQEAPVNEALFSRCIALNLGIVEKTPAQIQQFSQNMAELDKGIGEILFKLLQFRPIIERDFKDQFFKLVTHFGQEIAAYNIANRTTVKANIRLLNNYACITAPLIVAMKNGLKLSRDGDSNADQLMVVEQALQTLIAQAEEESQLDEVNKFLEVVMIAATQSKPVLFPGHDFIADEVKGELIIKTSVISMFNELYEKIYKHKGPDQSAIKKYIKTKPYFKAKRKCYFLITGSDNNSKNARKTQLWGIVLDLKKLPEETSHYFNSIAAQLKKETANVITT